MKKQWFKIDGAKVFRKAENPIDGDKELLMIV